MNPADAHHLGIGPQHVAGNGGRGRICFLPGSVGRAERIAEHFVERAVHRNDRRLDVHLGRLVMDGTEVDAMAVPTGMGCPSLGIVVSELVAIGARRLLRIGTSGALQPGSPRSGVVIATGAVRDETTSDVIAPVGFPAIAHPDWVESLSRAAVVLGLGDEALRGVVHSKDSLYGRENPTGPMAESSRQYMRTLTDLGVLATEMESSHLFTLAAALGVPDVSPVTRASPTGVVKAGAVLALIGAPDEGFGPQDIAAAAEKRSIEVGIRAAVELIRLEDSSGR